MDAGRSIGGTGPTRDEADAWSAGYFADSLGHDGGRAFVATDGESDAAAVEGVERGKIAFARHAKGVPYTLNRQLIDQNFAAGAGVVFAAHRIYFTIFAGEIFGENGAGVISQLDCSITLPAFAFSARKCFQSGSCIIFARFCSRSPALTAFADEIVMWLTHVAELHRIGELAVEVELRRYSARQNPISPMVDEH
jgi:hypothetical protein